MSAVDGMWVERARSIPIEDEIARRGIKLRGTIDRCGPCPKCGGDDRFSINVKKQVFRCRGCGTGGDIIDLVQHLDGVDFLTACTTLTGSPAPQMNGHAAPEPKKVTAARYDYRDKDGNLLFVVARIELQNPDGTFVLKNGKRAKTFRQARPDPANPGKWLYNVDGVRPVPYRLPELTEAIALDHPVFIVEGEQKVEALGTWNLHATCNAAGAGKWTAEHATFLKGADVTIIPDNDSAGLSHVDQVARSLQGIASRVRVLKLPGLDAKGDIVDWQKLGHTREEFDALVDKAPDWQLQPNTTAGQPATAGTAEPLPDQSAPLAWLPLLQWDGQPVPTRKWAIPNRVPLNQAGLLSGEGGTGKSIIELTKDVAHVLGAEWLHSLPEQGPAFYLGAEDTEDELHIRLAAIAKHYNTSFAELAANGLHVMCLLGIDATLCASTRGGKVETTALYRQIYEAAGDIKPKNISIDTLSRAFAGNEIDRTQVYAFANHMQALAMAASGAVTVLAHPSLSGIASGSGISGSTAWHGAFRFRQYLTGIKPDSGEQPDNDLRQLEFKKNQYGPLGESIVLRYQNGLFLPEAGISTLNRIARDQAAEDAFLDLLRRFTTEGRNVGDKPTSPNYAPSAFAKEAEAKKLQLRKVDLEPAMRRLFASSKIHVEHYGRPARPASRLQIGPAPERAATV